MADLTTAAQSPDPATALAVDEGHRRRWAVFAVVVLGAFMAQLDLFIVNIAFPAISRGFAGSTASGLSWVLNGYAIVFAACLVPAGRLADLIGRRRTFELGVIVFAIGSAGCAAAPSVMLLVAARVVQAIGAAMVIPTSLGLLLHVFPAHERAGATGAWASGAAVAASAGPPLGGLLVLLSWRWIFIVNLPLAVIALIGSRKIVPEVRHQETGSRPDLLGMVVLITGIAGLVLAIVQGQAWGWTSASFLLVLAATLILLALFLRRCARHPSPIVELSLLRLRPFAVANVTMLAFYIAFGAMLLGAVLFLTGIWHQTTIIAGLMIAPGPAVVALISNHVKKLVARFGARSVAVIGSLMMAAGGAWWALRIGPTPNYAGEFLPGMLAAGTGVGLTQATLYGVVGGTLPSHRFATGSGVLNMSRQIALALGVAVLVAVLGSAPGLAEFQRAFYVMTAGGLIAAAAATQLGAQPASTGRRRS